MADRNQPTEDVVVLKPGESSETWTESEVENYFSAKDDVVSEVIKQKKKGF